MLRFLFYETDRSIRKLRLLLQHARSSSFLENNDRNNKTLTESYSFLLFSGSESKERHIDTACTMNYGNHSAANMKWETNEKFLQTLSSKFLLFLAFDDRKLKGKTCDIGHIIHGRPRYSLPAIYSMGYLDDCMAGRLYCGQP